MLDFGVDPPTEYFCWSLCVWQRCMITSTRDVSMYRGDSCMDMSWAGSIPNGMPWHAMVHRSAIGAIGLGQPTKHHLKSFTNTFLTLLSPHPETFSLSARQHHWGHEKLLLYLSRLPESPGILQDTRIRPLGGELYWGGGCLKGTIYIWTNPNGGFSK